MAESPAVGTSASAELDGLMDAPRLVETDAVDVGLTAADVEAADVGDSVGTISRHAMRTMVPIPQPLEMRRVRPSLSYAKPAPHVGGFDHKRTAQSESAVVSASSATATRKWEGPGPAADSRITPDSVSYTRELT
jgi:hypothetical protein